MEEKFFAFTYNKHIYTVNLNSKQSREDVRPGLIITLERNSNGSRRVLVKGIGFCMTLTCTRYDVAILLRIMMLYYNTSTKTLDQKCQLTQVAADVCLHFMVVVLQLMFLTSPTLTQKT